MKLSAIRLFVAELSRAKAFYAQTLGLRLARDGSAQGYCAFESAGISVIVEEVASDAPGKERALVGRFVGLSFAVENVTAEHERLAALGVRFTGFPEKQFWGGWLATFMDPSGNELQPAQYPA